MQMLWGLEYAKTVVSKRLSEYENTVEVSRSEALDKYLDARTQIEKRLQSIVKSDKDQQFKIDTHLLENI